ncbi:succinate dehydrogenase subunit (SDH9) [Trypanosoma cruzi cruzi]|nr:succinate dehydrogenase subunit [Trypanosoma cruzi]PBJ72517.1 succinate dehydrogenase subunit (SDH9) [Trypanosoma cruzi cruzi]
MFSRTFPRRIGSETYGGWPWPVKLPFKADWYHKLSSRQSIADENREYTVIGDILILSIVAFATYRVNELYFRSNAYQTHLCHLTQAPPAIIANEFDFKKAENNRKVSRTVLDEYREAVVACKAQRQPIESVIFNF